jgi:peptide-methionine (S)-S-oxide reductase
MAMKSASAIIIVSVLLLLSVAAVATGPGSGSALSGEPFPSSSPDQSDMTKESKVTLGAGCFWCVEAVFKRVNGVKSAVSGYSGGRKDEASYRIVSTGETNHAEVVQVTFDPEVISFDAILQIYWRTHDPTTLNRQGADVGPQYRSVIFYHDDFQRERAEYFKKKLDESGIFDDPIVTEITPLEAFYEAEEYHQDYFERNPDQGYCQIVIRPKIDKFKILFEEKLREEFRP